MYVYVILISDLPVMIVDGIAPVVLYMPTEAAEAHSYVAPRYFHTRHISRHVFQYRLLMHRKIVQVPRTRYIFLDKQFTRLESMKNVRPQ